MVLELCLCDSPHSYKEAATVPNISSFKNVPKGSWHRERTVSHVSSFYHQRLQSSLRDLSADSLARIESCDTIALSGVRKAKRESEWGINRGPPTENAVLGAPQLSRHFHSRDLIS